MFIKDGIVIEKEAFYGIILEKNYLMDVIYEELKNNKNVKNLEKVMNYIWGQTIIYCNYKDKSIVILSARGCPLAANAIERMVRTGVKYIVSIGTCGSTDESIKVGSFLLATAAVRDEGTTPGYLNIEVPALADLDLTFRLKTEFEKIGVNPKLGVIYTTDQRFKEKPEILKMLFKRANVINIDMETAAIILISTYHNIPVAAVNIVTDCAVKEIEGDLKGIFDATDDYFNFTTPKITLAVKITLNLFTKLEK